MNIDSETSYIVYRVDCEKSTSNWYFIMLTCNDDNTDWQYIEPIKAYNQ